MASLQYPGYSIPDPGPSPLLALAKGFEEGRNERRDEQAFLAAAGLGQPGQTKQPTGPAQGLDFLRNMFAGPQAYAPEAARPGVIEGSHAAAAAATDPNLSDYFASIRSAESGGNDAAKNPNSSATGRYQFTEGTWNDLAQNYPALGLTADGRTDPAQQERAIRQFTSDNARSLSGAGIAVNPGNLYAAHFLGSGGAQSVLTGQDNAPVSAYVGPEVVQANPFLADMTVGDFKAWAAQKGGGQGGGYAPPSAVAGIPQATGPKYTLPDRETMLALFRSPQTRDIATALAQGAINGQNAQALQTFERPDGSIWQFNPETGELGVVQDGLDRTYKQAQIDALRAKPAAQAARPLAPEERAQWGIPDSDTRPYSIVPGKAPTPVGGSSGQTINVNAGDNSNAFTKKGDEDAASRLGTIVEGGQGAAQFMGDIKALAALGSQIDTGLGAQLTTQLGPYAEALGVNIEGLGEAQAYQAIIDRMAPAMRPAGSGASSDFDARQFLSSLPGLGRTPEGNQIITQTLSALQQHKMAAAEIASTAFLPKDQGGISWQEAERQIRELPDPYDGFNAYRKTAENAQSAQPGGLARPQTQADFDAIPSGGLYIDPDDGLTYRKN